MHYGIHSKVLAMTEFLVPTSETLLDPSKASDLLGLADGHRIKAISSKDGMDGSGGLSGDMNKIQYELEDKTILSVVKKSTKEVSVVNSKALGLAREGIFYSKLAPRITSLFPNILPKVFYAYGDMDTGKKLIIMEDLVELKGIQAGYFFGSGSPHNWGKDLDTLTAGVKFSENAAVEISRAAFKIAAKFHGIFWMDKKLLSAEYCWLRGSSWLQKEGENSFQAAQKQAADMWKTTSASIAAGTSEVKWDPLVLECVTASFGKVDWTAFQSRLSAMQWTLTHSDYHPANMMWIPQPESECAGYLKVLDWEVVGFGSGPQDLAQFLISHMEPSLRRSCEEQLVREYYEELCQAPAVAANGTTEFTWTSCWEEYVRGGSERWIWLLALLSVICPPKLTQYFQDQVAAFLRDHGVTADSIDMPRV